MATIVDRPSGFPVGAAHHARNPQWVRPPHHTRHARTSRPVRHAGRRRRYVLRDLALALTCFVLLTAWRAPPWLVVILAALGGVGLALAG